MILSDRTIKEKMQTKEITVEPFDAKNLQPASYDLHLGNEFRVFKPHETEIIDTKKPVRGFMEEVHVDDDGAFVLHPGNFALGLIKEKTGVDSKHVGRLEGKSSLARLGLIIHTTAGFLDAGNCLRLTLELFNASPLPIKLYPGMKIAQIAFETLSTECEKPYGSEGLNSKYYGSEGIDESRMYLNFENNKTEETTDLEEVQREFVATVYVVKEGKVLMTWNKKINKFIPLGGHVDKNELPSDCAVREAKEESGYDVELFDLGNLENANLPQNMDIQVDIIKPNHHHINLSYIGKIVGGQMLQESDEGTELRWFSPWEIKMNSDILDNTKEKALKAIEFVESKSSHEKIL